MRIPHTTLALLGISLVAASAQAAEPSPSFRVTDQHGNPLAGVSGGQLIQIERARESNSTISRPVDPSGADGIVKLLGPDDLKRPHERIRASDKLHYTLWLIGETRGARVEIAQGQPFPETVQLQPLVDLEIHVEGPVLPEFVPIVVPMEKTVDAIFGKSFYANPTPIGSEKSRWYVPLIDDELYIIGWIDTNPPQIPGKPPHEQPISRMLGYLSEPFVARDGTTIDIEPGLPATVEYDLSAPPAGNKIFPLRVRFGRLYQNGNHETFSPFMNSFVIEEPQTVRFQPAAQGRWKLSAETWGDDGFGPSPMLYDEREVRIESGQDVLLTPVYPTIDNAVDKGDLTIRGNVVDGHGGPVSNLSVWVLPWSKDPERQYGAFTPPVTTDAEGRFVIDGLSPENTYHVNTIGPDGHKASAPIGDGAYNADGVAVTRLIVQGDPERRRPRKGQSLDDLIVEWTDGTSSGMEAYKGKTVLIDVWATWCKPCIAAFPEYDALAKKYSDDSSVVFLALNVDSGAETWKTYLSQNDLPNVRHGWMDNLKNAIRFNPLPHHVIIGRNGEIAAIGGPEVDFEEWLEAR